MAKQPDALIGILMLDTRFPRPVGDIGNPATWPFGVRYAVVRDADPAAVIAGDAHALTAAFIRAGQGLIDQGARALTTSCGFLCLIQRELQAALPVPLLASALNQAPMIVSLLPAGQHLTVLTIAAERLTSAHLAAAGVPADTPICGMDPAGPFADAILNNRSELDQAACRTEFARKAAEIRSRYPATGALLLECTNMAPYAAELGEALGCAVFSIDSAVAWLRNGLHPRRFSGGSATAATG